MKKISPHQLELILANKASSVQEIDGKLYVTPGSVYVAPDAIYVNIEGNFIIVEGIASDSNGIYILDVECARDGERKFHCLKCGKYHSARQGCPKD